MTQAEFNKHYKEQYPNYKVMTLTDRRLYYNDLMESYFRSNLITERQRNTWGHPAFLSKNIYQINSSSY